MHSANWVTQCKLPAPSPSPALLSFQSRASTVVASCDSLSSRINKLLEEVVVLHNIVAVMLSKEVGDGGGGGNCRRRREDDGKLDK